ncbi:MAG: 30S ribosomal protein S15 [Gammaproteobacteria bacterium]|nr:30S ribosomal protein S15 [Gammaproteobacteria bacterium]
MSVAHPEAKARIIGEYQCSVGDTGSSSVQIALLTHRIRHLTEHLKTHKKDFHTAYGLKKLVSQRRKLMKYYKRTDLAAYQALIARLELRDIR